MPAAKEDKPVGKRPKRDGKDGREGSVRNEQVKNKKTDGVTGSKVGLTKDLEDPMSDDERRGSRSKPLPMDNDFIRMCEENLSDITRRYLQNDSNPLSLFQNVPYRGALAVDLKASSILDDDDDDYDRDMSLRISKSFKHSKLSGNSKDIDLS